MTCPECREPDRTVGDPQESDEGHSGKWYCFACGAHGSYTVEMEVTGGTGSTPPE